MLKLSDIDVKIKGLYMDKSIISTKADRLLAISDVLKKSYIEKSMVIRVSDFTKSKTVIFHTISEMFKGDKIVVRSSSKNEDSMSGSNAGHYESVLNVNSSDYEEVCQAIVTVINSYMDNNVSDAAMADISEEQILIQKQATDIIMSGVIFTRDIVNNTPYYMISYDEDGTTDYVTSGQGGKTKWIARNVSREFVDEQFYSILEAVKELEGIFSDVEALDIEFGVNSQKQVVIFQVTPLVAVINNAKPMTDKDFADTKSFAKCAYLDTNHMMSDMAYWNPADVIGTNPRPLDYSLYSEFITASVWTDAIAKLGYDNVSAELMQKIGNKPFVSINRAIEGLTPRGLDSQLKYKLNQYYREELAKDKNIHSTIEQQLLFNSFDFVTDKKLQDMMEHGFTEVEFWRIREALYKLTINVLASYDNICNRDLNDIDQLAQIRHQIREEAPLTETNVMKLYKYVEELRTSILEHGAPQFVRQARCAAIAKKFCDSLVEGDFFSKDEMDSFMLSIPTVKTEFESDFESYRKGQLSKEEFNKKYGHQRLGTYDIRTDCYGNMQFDSVSLKTNSIKKKNIQGKLLDYDKLKKALEAAGLKVTPEKFTDFLIKATKNREYFHSEYTKSLSLMLEIIIKLGDVLGIAREDMSYLEIQELSSYHSRDSYIQIIESRRTMYHANSYLMLPEVILGLGDIDVIDFDETKPNFITTKVVEADIVNLDNNNNRDIEGKIVVLTKADPGYDWIFDKNIAGFVTKYGGVASHMAIRCAEFGVPAAIGCGEILYKEVTSMLRMKLDCENGKIIEISPLED